MPQYEFTFTDQSTIAVNAPDPVAARKHVDALLTIATHTPQNPELKGKAVASATPKVLKP